MYLSYRANYPDIFEHQVALEKFLLAVKCHSRFFELDGMAVDN